MIRLAVVLAAVAAVVVAAVIWQAAGDYRLRHRVDRRQVVLDEEIQQNARDNYWLLARSVRLHQQVLDADAVMPYLSAALRRDLLGVVTEFNDEPTKGTK